MLIMFKNTFKTTILLASMGGLIVGIAGLLGGGSSSSVMIGLMLALVMVGGSYWFSDSLALKSANAQVITEADHPEFYGMIRDLSQRAGLPMPRVAVSPLTSQMHLQLVAAQIKQLSVQQLASCNP